MLREIRKFTPKAEVDRMLGAPVFQLEDRPAYYYGGGFVIHDSPVRFRVEGIWRAEYGETGEYAVGGYHFPDTGTLQMELGLTQFEAGDMAPLWEDTVDGAVTYQSTFREIHRWAVLHAVEGCQEGETRGTGMNFTFTGDPERRRRQVSGSRFPNEREIPVEKVGGRWI